MPVYLRLYPCRRAQRIPQSVNFIEHHQPGIAPLVFGNEMFAPDRQVRLRHASVGCKNENYRMRLGNQADGEFRLGTNGVEPGGVKNNQPLLQQWVGNIDQRVAPPGYLDQPVSADHRIVFGIAVMPEAKRTGLVTRHVFDLGHFLKCLGQLRSVIHVQVNACPFLRHVSPLHERLCLQPCFDGQQAQAGRNVRVIPQLRRTHGGAPRAGRHDAATITGKKNRIDQLGFAA